MPPTHCEKIGKDRRRIEKGKIKKEDGGIKKEFGAKKTIKIEYDMEKKIKTELKKEAIDETKDDDTMEMKPISDPDIPYPWRAYLLMSKMMVYYFNHETSDKTWNRKDVEEWKKTHKGTGIEKLSERAAEMANLDDEDIQFIKEIRSKKHDPPSTSPPKSSNKLNLDSDSIAIFDTSALIEMPDILEIAVKYHATVVIPYKVVQELDGLKKSTRPRVAPKAAKVHRTLDCLSSKNDPLLILESGKELNEQLEGFIVETPDDKILKCALVIERCLAGRRRNIYFVTNDANLRLKTRGFNTSLEVVEGEEFVNGLVKSWSEKEKELKEIKESPSGKNENEVKRKKKEELEKDVVLIEKPPQTNKREGVALNLKKGIHRHLKMISPSTSKNEVDEIVKKKKKKGEVEVVQIEDDEEEEEEEVQIIQAITQEDDDDGIIDVDVPPPPIPNEIWDEYRKPSELFQKILAETPSIIYAEFINCFNNVLIRRKAFDDLKQIKDSVNALLEWKWSDSSIEDRLMHLYHIVHSLHQYYVMRKPFPPQYLEKELLLGELKTLGEFRVKSWVNEVNECLGRFEPPSDINLFGN